jgi:hypothetical protein
VEWVVLQSQHPAHPPGSTANMVIRMDVQYPDTPIGEVKGFGACLFGLDPTSSHPDMEARIQREITPEVIKGIKRPENPMRGSVLAATVFTTTGEKPFQGKYRFRPVVENGQPKRVSLPPRTQPAPASPPGYGQPYTPPAGPPAGPPAVPGSPGPGGWVSPGYPPAGPPASPPGYGQPYAPPVTPSPMPSGGAPAWTPPAPAAPPAAPAAPPPFPPAGWAPHPQAPGYLYKGSTVLTEAQLRAAMAAGQA